MEQSRALKSTTTERSECGRAMPSSKGGVRHLSVRHTLWNGGMD